MTNALTPADTSQPNDRGAIERFTAEWNASYEGQGRREADEHGD